MHTDRVLSNVADSFFFYAQPSATLIVFKIISKNNQTCRHNRHLQMIPAIVSFG